MTTFRKYCCLLIALCVLGLAFGLAAPASAAPGDIVVSYTLPFTQININDNFSVPVHVAVTSAQPITGLQFNMSWDPAVLDLVSVTKGTYFVNCSLVASDFLNAPTINHAAGTMSNYSIAGLGIPSGQGCYNIGQGANTTTDMMATLNFKAKANGTSTQAISGILFSNVNSIAVDPANYTFPGFLLHVGSYKTFLPLVVR
ncbi:MAG TPA: cohesin domain-containing protein [Anaerolineaceae bacterium]|nr:cohesin domain-containing protein [Anaerolineaceae bacterium]